MKVLRWMSRYPATPPVAEAGALTLLGGGERCAFESAEPSFAPIASQSPAL
jgi:3-hydroxyisobutyrate dehydrogenase-like beta-hydroxyacid dehydrogenase